MGSIYKVILCKGSIFPPGMFNKEVNIIKEEQEEEYKNLKKAINAGLCILTHPITYNHKVRTSWIEIIEHKISKIDGSEKEKAILIIAPEPMAMISENEFIPYFHWYKDYAYGNPELKQQLENKSNTPVMDLFKELSGMDIEKDQK